MSADSNTKNIGRREIREQCFAVLFEMTFSDAAPDDILDAAVESRTIISNEFSEKLLNSFYNNKDKVDEVISANIKGWKLSRLSRVTLSILRLAVTEILYLDTPDSVVINEAVELAKKYGTPKEASFINGVLGSAAKKRETENVTAE